MGNKFIATTAHRDPSDFRYVIAQVKPGSCNKAEQFQESKNAVERKWSLTSRSPLAYFMLPLLLERFGEA